jgi:RNA polymerase primary sigma factor
MNSAPSTPNGLEAIAQALHTGRQRKALMDAALAAFRALALHERAQFLLLLEEDMTNGAAPYTAPENVGPVQTPPAAAKRTGPGRPATYHSDDLASKRVLDLAALGKTERAIARETGIPPSSVHTIKARAKPVASRGTYAKHSPEDLQRVLDLAALGMSLRQIEHETGVPRQTITAIQARATGAPTGLAPLDRMTPRAGVDIIQGARAAGQRRARAADPSQTLPASPPREPRARAPKPSAVSTIPPKTSSPEGPRARERASGTKRPPTSDSEDSPAIYFRQISKHALLTGAQEIALAKQIEDLEIQTWCQLLKSPMASRVRDIVLAHAGEDQPLALSEDIDSAAAALRTFDLERKTVDAAAAEFQQQGSIDPEARRALREMCVEAVRLRHLFVQANLRLVISMARRYLYTGLSLVDLIQEGNLGLVHAVPRFDHRRGLRFSTFASWWIRHALSRAGHDKGRAVRIPVHLRDAATAAYTHTKRLTRELGRAPSQGELAKALGTTEKKLQQSIGPGYWLTGPGQSLDAPFGDDGDRTFLDNLVDAQSEESSTLRILIDAEQKERVTHALQRLPEGAADLLRKRYGLDGGEGLTLREVSEIRGLSRERIRQLEVTALAKLRGLMAATS